MLRKNFLIILVFCLVFLAAGLFPFTAQGAEPYPILVGLYPSAELYTSVEEINTYNTDFGGDVFSMAGTFLDFESPDWFINAELAAAFNNKYLPFVNLGAGGYGTEYTAEEIANGVLDAEIRNWANVYEFWAKGGDVGRRAFIAPLQEMNGGYAPYSGDAENFIKAYLRIQQIFMEEGVPEDSVSWVYAPNGWHNSTTGYPFEEGYPGDSAVDIVAFSSFNWGDCWTYTSSQGYEEIFEPYLIRMQAMAPGKPIFIAEIGSLTEGLDRGVWFTDTLSKIGDFPAVKGLLYFNRSETPFIDNPSQQCLTIDHRLEAGDPYPNEGLAEFEQIVTQPPYGYWAPNSPEMMNIVFSRPISTFEDVWEASEFSEQSSIYYQSWVERLADAGITGGCGSTTIDLGPVTDFTYNYYCPNNAVTRAQMAVFLQKGIGGSTFTPPPADGSHPFSDIAGHWAEDWIEELYDTGMTGGYPDGTYRPQNQVTRAQMAVFLLRAKYGNTYTPPPASGGSFTDVAGHWAEAWIEQLALEGITSGYPDGTYRPELLIIRGQMAVFLVKTFDLP